MNIQFSKMHGTENSFILIHDLSDILTPLLADAPETVIQLCSRETGLGADGLILIQKSQDPSCHFKLLIYNAEDASLAEMCGNAVRCVSQFLYDTGYHKEKHCTLDTPAGIIAIERLEQTESEATVRVNMGIPHFTSPDFIAPSPAAHPLLTDIETTPSHLQAFQHEEFIGFFVSMGNPHAVIPVTHYDFDYTALAIRLQKRTELFPSGVNVGFLNYLPTPSPPTLNNNIAAELRVIERGVGETASCGTGACAAAVTLSYLPPMIKLLPTAQRPEKSSTNVAVPPNLQKSVQKSVYQIKLKGGILTLKWNPSDPSPLDPALAKIEPIFMTGTATHIATGTLIL